MIKKCCTVCSLGFLLEENMIDQEEILPFLIFPKHPVSDTMYMIGKNVLYIYFNVPWWLQLGIFLEYLKT